MDEDECCVWLIWRRGPGIEVADLGFWRELKRQLFLGSHLSHLKTTTNTVKYRLIWEKCNRILLLAVSEQREGSENFYRRGITTTGSSTTPSSGFDEIEVGIVLARGKAGVWIRLLAISGTVAKQMSTGNPLQANQISNSCSCENLICLYLWSTGRCVETTVWRQTLAAGWEPKSRAEREEGGGQPIGQWTRSSPR